MSEVLDGLLHIFYIASALFCGWLVVDILWPML